MQGFHKICADQWEFATDGFFKGNKDGLKNIRRRKPSTSLSSSLNMDHPEAECQDKTRMCNKTAHAELLETIARLQQEKTTLVMELTNLNQQRRSMEKDLEEFGKQLVMLENRQQQILTFLTRVVSNPELLNQLFQQQEAEMLTLMPVNKRCKFLESNEREIMVELNQDRCFKERDASGNQLNHIDNAISSNMSYIRILDWLGISSSKRNSPKSHNLGVTLTEISTPSEHPLNDVCEDYSSPHHSMDNQDQVPLYKLNDHVVSLPLQQVHKGMGKKSAVQSSQTNDGFWEKYLTENPTSTDVESNVQTDVGNEVNSLESSLL